ncbi:MAG: hypothetical protein J6X53_10010, partial [Abditibacteriota bacterium]|nr:hypothetical protein [Abditibacteriota bacterium]
VYNAPTQTLNVQLYAEGTKDPIAGTQFLLTDSSGKKLGTENGVCTTDSNGRITLSGLKPGLTVKIQQTSTADGFLIDSDAKTIAIESGDAQTVTVYNAPTQTLIVHLYVEGTTDPIAGAMFLLTDSTGKKLGTENGVFTTDSSGRFTLTGLKPGLTVNVKQTSTADGYLIDGEIKTIAIESGDAQTVTVYNAPKQSFTLRLYAKGTETPIPGARFLVTDGSGTKLGDADGTFTTDEVGRFSITGLTPGVTVKVEQISTADGFLPDAAPKAATIKSGSEQTVTVYNTTTQALTVQLYVEETTEPIAGAKFLLTDSTGAKLGEESGVFTTDANGRFSLANLAPGMTVKIKQTSTADGYLIDSDTHTIAIKSGDEQTVTVYNAPMQTLTVKLYVKDTTTPIAGAKFLLKDSGGKLIGDANGVFTTNQNGEFSIHGLTPGVTITAVQTDTISGYIPDGNPQSILIQAGNAQNMVFYNPVKGAVTIRKIDANTEAPLPGAEFKVTTLQGVPVDDNEGQTSTGGISRTDASGEIHLAK